MKIEEGLTLLVSNEWKEYQLLDAGNGMRLERWGNVTLSRPDPQVIWPARNSNGWNNVDAVYHRSDRGGGEWEFRSRIPESWVVKYKGLSFIVHPTNFKHTGLFPEQAVNWDWIRAQIKGADRQLRVLNLFGYTGAATVAAAAAGADVTHLDASKGVVTWCKDNIAESGLSDRPVRYIVDDAIKFVQREARRGKQYDAIIMDPPSFGRGSRGEVWKLEEHLWGLFEDCREILSPNPAFFLVNSYTTGISPVIIRNMLAELLAGKGGTLSCGEVGLPIQADGKILPAGIFARWTAQNS